MKKNNKKFLNELNDTLSPINELIDLPDELSENSIAALVADKEQTGKKSARKKLIRTLSTVAAALVIALGIGFYADYITSPAIEKIPQAVADAEVPLSGNDKQVFIDYFTAVKAEYDENYKFYYSFDDFLAKNESAVLEDGAMEVPEAESFIGATGTVVLNSSASDTADFGTTNTQVMDIDEDDIVKNDGKYIYYLTDWTVKIVDAGSMKLVSEIDLYIDSVTGVNGMYIYGGDKLAVIGTSWGEHYKTHLFTFDISDKTNPKKLNTFTQDGDYFSTRLLDGKIILISQYTVYPKNITIFNGYAKYDDVVPETVIDGVSQALDSQRISILPQDEDNCSTTYVVMSVIDLDDPEFKPETSAILGNGREVYCTKNYLYIISQEYNLPEFRVGFFENTSSKTVINRFDFSSGVVSSDGIGEVPGSILNQFSLDEKDGYIRIATTLTESNMITVLDKNLKTVASIDNIAPGETIQSVRYIGKYGYVVTFRQTDPLFVIDFTDIRNPKIVGELKIPGFSSYLHPFNGYLVGIGTDGDEFGAVNALKISLFDISDPTNPLEVDRFIIKQAYAYSLHKTVMDCSGRNILGFIYDGFDPESDHYLQGLFCTLKIENGKIEPIGIYSDYFEEEQKTAPVYSSDGRKQDISYSSSSEFGKAIRRATYIGDTLYTLSDARISSYPIEGGVLIDSLTF